MPEPEIEPGLLPVFRLFVWIQLGLLAILLLAGQAHWDRHSPGPLLMMTVGLALLVGYLHWPGLPGRLGRRYLPLGLLASAGLPAIWFYADARVSGRLSDIAGKDTNWQLLLLLFPLLLASWQYRFRWAALFCLGVSLVDLLLMATIFTHAELVQANYGREVFLRLMVFLAVSYIVTRLVEEQRRQRQALQEANARLANFAATLEQLAVSQERNRLARELHDTLAHTLSGIAVQLEAARALWEVDAGQAHTLLEQSLGATRAGLGETRRALHALRAAPLEDLGLCQALQALAETAAQRAGFQLCLSLAEGLDGLPPAVEQALYRAAQELLENIARHAQAGRVQVRLERRPGQGERI